MTATDDLLNRFTYHPPTDPRLPELYELIRDTGLQMALLAARLTPPSRESSLAVTKVEEAVMWLNAAVARHGIAEPLSTRLGDHAPEVFARLAWADVLTELAAARPNASALQVRVTRGDD